MNQRLATERESARFSEVLSGLAGADGERLSLAEIVHAFGERGFGAIMLLVSLLNLLPLPPGSTTVTGAPLLILGVQMMLGRDTVWLPRWLCRASVSREGFRQGLKRVLPWLEKAERLTRPRLSWAVTGPAERLIGLAIVLLSCVLVLPVWLGNLAPAAAIAVLSLGLVQRDGVLVLIGWGVVAVAVGLLVLAWSVIVGTAVNTYEWVLRRF
jgi:hypothetical protein